MWPGFAVLVAFLPFLRGLSLTNIFFVRDLTLFFWPRHLWIRDTLLGGGLPLWDPYAAGGQPAYPDALNQLFLLPVTLLRVLFPAALGFNLIVALPLPLAALGTWLFLRRHVSASSAAIGSMAFAASGCALSTANFPNLSWSIAWTSWMLWAADRDVAAPSARRLAALSGFAALQMLSGEPVTMAGSLAIVGAYMLSRCPGRSISAWARVAGRFAAAVAVAAVVAAVQLVPMVLAAGHSPRSVLDDAAFWSLHPLWGVEALLPHVFGDTFTAYNSALPWVPPLNSGREPFFFSIYLGPGVLLLALLGSLTGERRWRAFWVGVAAAGLACGLGTYTPVYAALQAVVPGLRSFRFPVKFLLFVALGLAMLCAAGAEALLAERGAAGNTAARRGAVRAMLGAGLAGGVLLAALIGAIAFAPFMAARAFFRLGQLVGVADPIAAAQFLFDHAPPAAARALFVLVLSVLLATLACSRRREAAAARLALIVLIAGDLLVVQSGLNPVMPVSDFQAPRWTAALARPSERFYFGGKFRGSLIEADPDLALLGWHAVPGLSVVEGRAVLSTYAALTPAAWHAREILSYDLPLLWPVEQHWAVALFEQADRQERLRFLERSGVRYCLTGAPMHPGDRLVAEFAEAFATVRMYECVPDARRAYVADTARVVADRSTAMLQLFREASTGADPVRLEAPPPAPSGIAGPPAAPSARFIEDGANVVSIEAAAGADGGYLVLLDSYDPAWRVEVDGAPAPLLRADVLFRAVRLAPGPHRVVFTHRPVGLYLWGATSAVAALALMTVLVFWRRRARPGSA